MTEPVVKIENVHFQYNSELVLEDITFDINRGDFLGIIGPNGSGKTTLLRMLGLLAPTNGSVKLFGKDIRVFKDWDKVGYVPQKAGSHIYHFPVTVSEIVSSGFKSTRESKKKIESALRDVDMWAFKSRLINELSGGQQQRVFIARALVSSPELLLLDEPTSGVDVEAQAEFYKLLRKLNKELKLTLVLVSHDIDVVTREVSTIVCLNGKLICHLHPKDFNKEEYMHDIYGKDLQFVHHDHHRHHDH